MVYIFYLLVLVYAVYELKFSCCSEIKMSSFVDQSNATYEQFHKDKGRTLSYNEEQIHKYDKFVINSLQFFLI